MTSKRYRKLMTALLTRMMDGADDWPNKGGVLRACKTAKALKGMSYQQSWEHFELARTIYGMADIRR